MILLDTNYLVMVLLPGTPQAQRVLDWLDAGETVKVNVMVWAEFLCGPVTQEQIRLARYFAPGPVPLVAADAARGAELFNATGRRRGSLADCLIAATCLRLGARLATENRDDFIRFEPLGVHLTEPGGSH